MSRVISSDCAVVAPDAFEPGLSESSPFKRAQLRRPRILYRSSTASASMRSALAWPDDHDGTHSDDMDVEPSKWMHVGNRVHTRIEDVIEKEVANWLELDGSWQGSISKTRAK